MPLDLLDMLSKPPVKIGGRASALVEREYKPCGEERILKHGGRDYAKKYVQKEEELYKISSNKYLKDDERHGALSEVDTVTNCLSEMTIEDAENKLKLYDEHSFDNRKNVPNLPISEYKSKLLDMIDAYKVVIVKGATGCGKTTQIPQYILDECKEKREPCSIVVTQPRRLAAISVAKRVCEERNWKLGTVVGYQIGQHRVGDENTAITYCTTGILLQKLVQQRSLQGYTHIILDEIHERDAEMDFLLIIVRKFLNTISRNVKVILMSATISTDKFSEYFYSISDNQRFHAPVLEATRDNIYAVQIYYLNNCSSIPEARLMRPDGPDITKKGYMTAVKIVIALDTMDKKDAEQKKTKLVKGSVLIFLPGLYEIEEMKKHLDSMNESGSNKEKREHEWWIVPLHSSITAEEQDKVFQNPPQNQRKIILSTNIAESSITVQDTKYVIDFCLTKVVVTDPKTNLSSLQLCWASKNSCTQRAGRVGRVMEGKVYRLVDEAFYEDLDEDAVPEMLRCPLDRLVLQTKLLEQGPPKAVFALALSQPDLRNIEQTVLTLKEIGALLITTRKIGVGKDGKKEEEVYIDDFDGDLTYLGRIIAKLPMDVRLGKLIFFGNLFNVLDECIIMACAMSTKNVFSTPFLENLKAYNMKLGWANSTCSDSIAYLIAYTTWRKKKAEGEFRNSDKETKWCKDRFLQAKVLREIHALQQDVFNRIKGSDMFVPRKENVRLTPTQTNLLLKLAFSAAFYPNYFLRGFHGGQVDEKEAVAALCGHDPYTTVFLQGMPINQSGILYKKSIEQHFKQVSSRVNVKFDSGSKVLVNFGHSRSEKVEGRSLEIPGKIDLAVYRAVKMRQTRPELRIPILNAEKAEARFQRCIELYNKNKNRNVDASYTETLLSWPWNKNLDSKMVEIVEISITHIESPTRFWAMGTSEMVRQVVRSQAELLSRPENIIPVQGNVKVGGIYVVQDTRDRRKLYYRCRVVSHKAHYDTYDIFFIDYGDMRFGVKRNEIMTFSPQLLREHNFDKIPDLAAEFCLVKVQPPPDREGKWPQTAVNFLQNYRRKEYGKKLYAKIYSVVNDVIRVKLYYNGENERDNETRSINRLLVENKMAEKSDEPFLSKQDHQSRMTIQKMITEGTARYSSQSRNLTEKEKLTEQLSSLDMEEPKREECSQEAVLKGPFSPLEMRIFSAAQCSMAKLAIIDRNSVNSVLLDTNPSDEHERMIVAAYVSINSAGDKLSLKDTTIMPSIPGLPTMICLMFSPMVELRCDSEYTKFTGALCGLGYDKSTGQSLNPDNDIEIVFDVEITLETMVRINKVRYWLNRIVCYGLDPEDDVKIEECQNKLTDYIPELIWEKWSPQDMQYNTETYKWNLIAHDKLLNPCIEENAAKMTEPAEDTTCVYRLIWGIELDGDPTIRLEYVKKNLNILHEFASGRQGPKNFECMLCQISIPNRMNATLHLKSGLHKARAQKYLDLIDKYSDVRSEFTEDHETY